MTTDDPRQRIQAEQQRVEGLVEDFRADLGTSERDAVPELSDPADAATDTFEREKDLSILEQLEHELEELQAALERVDAGTYGVDEETGAPIDPARLEAFPAARTNITGSDATAPGPETRDEY